MRIRLVLALLAFSAAAQASSSYRVGNELLTAGDSAARAIELLGTPTYKSHRIDYHRCDSGSDCSRDVHIAMVGVNVEQWQYLRDDRVVTVTIVDGKVSDIDDRRD
ncbi:DUF2845 domain-containing protein [Rhodanobacter sp. MP7CTX1]|uniref:DUF2845 domain-containing protein n=1 Tax=Rhodanobacter sp. MP7CTX1 TaxID=2723084 RepID=UPI00161D2C88|nr:hypothetical protein [Rhodanobacter sp. MP7CTX1]